MWAWGPGWCAFDPAYRNIVYNLLGRTVVVEDLDCGIAMARKYRNAFRIVTLDGQVINRGGSMTGGSTSRSAGVLSRAAELEQLTARTAAMQAKLAEAKQAEEDTARELAAAQYELETAEAQRRHAEDEVLRLEGIRGQYDLLLRSLEESVENLVGELESLAGRLTDNDARSAAAQVEIRPTGIRRRGRAGPGGGGSFRPIGAAGEVRCPGRGDQRQKERSGCPGGRAGGHSPQRRGPAGAVRGSLW